MRRHSLAAVLFLALAIVMTWPLGRLMNRALSDPGDPYINIWILDWGHYATFHQPLSLFHANAFHPARWSLAFSENLYGVALLLIPFRLAGVPPIAAYNTAMLAGFALCGFGAYLLGYRLTGSYPAGLAAGVFYAFVPFRFVHLSHLQHVWGGWLPLMLVALLAYVDRPGWRRAAAFGALFLMNGLTNIHWLFFGSFAAAVTSGLFYASGVRRWRELIICTLAALALLAPFLYPYMAASDLYGMTRSRVETLRFSAMLSDWFVDSSEPERRLHPGFLPMLLAAGGLFLLRRNPRVVVIGFVWIAIGVAGSLGLNFVFHEFLFDAVPGFKAVRVPARWATIAYIGMAILIASSTAAFPRAVRWALPIVLLVALHVAPIRWYLVEPAPPPVYEWLRQQRVRAVVELPINYAASEYRYLLRATAHHRRIVNGVSGFTPPLTATLTAMSKSAPIPIAFGETLRRIGTDLVIVHADQLGEHWPATRDWIRSEIERGTLRFVRRFDSGIRGDWVFAFGRGGDFVSPQPNAFLDGAFTKNESTFGFTEPPPPVVRGAATFEGWALSPHGIRKVDVLFQNGAVRVPATLHEDRRLSAALPWYPRTTRPRFRAVVPERPRGVRRKTDVQIEVTDGTGGVTRLENLWFEWEKN